MAGDTRTAVRASVRQYLDLHGIQGPPDRPGLYLHETQVMRLIEIVLDSFDRALEAHLTRKLEDMDEDF